MQLFLIFLLQFFANQEKNIYFKNKEENQLVHMFPEPQQKSSAGSL